MSASKKITATSLLVALGIIYGDIGTSPLYVLKAIVGDRSISQELIYGGISCVFWTICFQTTFKYIFLTLKADNKGEGGIMSLYALVNKYGKYTVIPTILGASTLLADGIITPPISVSSAVEGLTQVKGLEHISTVPIVIGILTLLFVFQRFGTHKIGGLFGPMMFIWFMMLAILGISQVIQNPEIIRALNPVHAYNLLTNYKEGFWLLGSVFLATTGAEALYADLGHCGRENIRVSWVFVKFCLIVNYLGQASWVMDLGANELLDGRNPFYEIMPDWFRLPGIAISTAAAIIASQALISGSFTLINEAMNMNFWPRVEVSQPSEIKGQIYIPSINFILWLGCVCVVLYFQNSSHMEAAYGLAITLTMMVTSYLLTYFLIYILRWNIFLIGIIVLLFAIVEISFFVANMLKFPEGGYITIMISVLFGFIMHSIYKGRKISNKLTKYVPIEKYTDKIKQLGADQEVPRFSTHLIYLTKAENDWEIEEKIMKSIFSKKPKRSDVYWFLHINRTDEPYTLTYDVKEIIDDTLIKINLNIGFKLQIRTEHYFKKIVQQLIANKELQMHIRPDGSTKYNAEPDYKFILIEKFLSVDNNFGFQDNILINAYFALKKISLSDEKSFGLEKSDVQFEMVPLLYQKSPDFVLKRLQPKAEN
ncbi:MAG: potassium transporter Kup [Flavobacteriaceae bacterium]|nr:MAG: potassium transporter Kup [Flavobacteriaceae bacterium]